MADAIFSVEELEDGSPEPKGTHQTDLYPTPGTRLKMPIDRRRCDHYGSICNG